MRLGVISGPPERDPAVWTEILANMGVKAVCFPRSAEAPGKEIDAFVSECKAHDLCIAEVGAWCNPFDREHGEENIRKCIRQLELAEYVGARCCVNISGNPGAGPWDGASLENYSQDTWKRAVETTQRIVDAVKPVRTSYTLEPMPWMIPDSPEEYLQLIDDVDRDGFAVHMDIVNMINSPRKYLFSNQFMTDAFRLLGNRIRSCHCKDIRLETNLTLHLSKVSCGEGSLNLRKYMELADAVDPEMPMLIEHLSGWEEYRESFQKVRKLLS